MFENSPVECLDEDKLFIKSGLTVIASLAGEGKTTFLHAKSKEWREQSYNVYHFNFDNAPTYGKDMINCPVSSDDFKDFWTLLNEHTSSKDIVIIDSLKAMVSYLGLDIENNSDMYPLLQSFRTTIKHTGVSIVLVHHAYKAKNVKTMPKSFYGSRSIEEQCDSGFIYEQTKVNIVKSRSGYARDSEIKILNPIEKQIKDL